MIISDEARIAQLTSPYSPLAPPKLPFEFGDYLSLIWRIDRHAGQMHLARYYSMCAESVARGLGLDQPSLRRTLRAVAPGEVASSLINVPFRGTGRLPDASARRAAIAQLVRLRADVLSIGSYQHDWVVGWPGSGIVDGELRDRVFATLFTALRSQYAHFGRLLLVTDIVLQELLLGTREPKEVSLGVLIDLFGYPDPDDPQVRALYNGEIEEEER